MCLACCMVKNHGLAYVSCVLHGQKSRLGPWLGVFWLWCLTGFVCVSWVLHGQKSRLGPWWGVFWLWCLTGFACVSWVLHDQKSRLGPWWGGFWLWCLTGFACVSWVLRGQTSQRRFQMCVSRPHIFVRCIVLFLVAFGFVNTSCPDAFGSLFCFQMHLVVSTMWFCQHGFCCFVDCVFVCDVCHGTFCQRGVCCFADCVFVSGACGGTFCCVLCFEHFLVMKSKFVLGINLD